LGLEVLGGLFKEALELAVATGHRLYHNLLIRGDAFAARRLGGQLHVSYTVVVVIIVVVVVYCILAVMGPSYC